MNAKAPGSSSGAILDSDRIELLHQAMETSEGRADPMASLARLHDSGGDLFWMPDGYWAVYSYSACDFVMRSPLFGREPPMKEHSRRVWPCELTGEQERILAEADNDELGMWIQLIDPPDHSRIKRLVNLAFTPSRVAALRGVIEESFNEALSSIDESEPIDIVERFARPVPRSVIGELIGLPLADREWFARHAAAQRHDKDPNATFEHLIEAAQGRRAIGDYVSAMLEERRRHPRDDLASALIAAEESGDRLSHPELVALVSMLYIAAYGTTADFISNTVVSLLRHPDQLEILRNQPQLVRQCNEESLRFTPIVVSLDYWTKGDAELAGEVIPQGSPMHVFLAAANRDPRVYEDPSRFDVQRVGSPSLTFGAGPHYCLGAALARMQGEIAISGLINNFRKWSLVEPKPELAGYFNYRSFRSAHVRLSI